MNGWKALPATQRLNPPAPLTSRGPTPFPQAPALTGTLMRRARSREALAAARPRSLARGARKERETERERSGSGSGPGAGGGGRGERGRGLSGGNGGGACADLARAPAESGSKSRETGARPCSAKGTRSRRSAAGLARAAPGGARAEGKHVTPLGALSTNFGVFCFFFFFFILQIQKEGRGRGLWTRLQNRGSQ